MIPNWFLLSRGIDQDDHSEFKKMTFHEISNIYIQILVTIDSQKTFFFLLDILYDLYSLLFCKHIFLTCSTTAFPTVYVRHALSQYKNLCIIIITLKTDFWNKVFHITLKRIFFGNLYNIFFNIAET